MAMLTEIFIFKYLPVSDTLYNETFLLYTSSKLSADPISIPAFPHLDNYTIRYDQDHISASIPARGGPII